MGLRKQRATTSKAYALDESYKKCLNDAKRIHRCDGEFYMYRIEKLNCWTSLSKVDYEMQPEAYYALSSLEHWKFVDKRWNNQTRI